MISKTGIKKITQYLKYDNLHGQPDKLSTRATQKYKKREENAIKG